MSNQNVGRSEEMNAGLILQTKKPEVDETEYGLLQATLLFHLLNENYSLLKPARGAACSDFTAGDGFTAAVLAEFDYLGKQTSKFVRNGHTKGIGTLEVFCQGAILSEPPSDVIYGPDGDEM